MVSTIGQSLLLSHPISVSLAVLMAASSFATNSASQPQPASGLRAACASSAGLIGGANPASPHTVQSVQSYYSHASGRCLVLLSRRPDQIGRVLPMITWRMLYDGHTGHVLAIASDENGTRTGRILDPEYKQATNFDSRYDEAVAYIMTSLK